ncbi:porin [Niastella caeni]|uniref:Porin n=1 Tax=Niastella caeni TaxID=2569763 RepID=A0A4S8HYR3_9BACT|nr:outer membrane beta-barrel protein [Niastella caeni]THU40933.1 porin [Niastella caeni]
MLRKISSLAIFTVALGSYVEAQDSTKKSPLTISGSVDAYYRYNFHNAKDSGYINNYTSFTNSQNSFELGMASVKAEYTTGKVTGVLDLGFGRRAEEFSYNEKGTGLGTAIKQAYISVAASEKLKFTMGKWATHVGYELVDAYLNRNYSMSYMFSFGPFFHTGLKAELTAGNFGFMLGVANPTDNVTASFAKKMIIGQISAANSSGKLKGYLNYQGGKDMAENTINQADLVITGTVSDKFSIGYNGTVQSVKLNGKSSGDTWWGSAVYLNIDPSKVFGVTLRGEYFDDKNALSGLAVASGIGTSVFAATLSGNIRIDNLTIIPEFRLDNSKDAIFAKNPNTGVKSTGTFLLGATWHF